MNIDLQTLVSIGSLLGVLIAVYKVYKYKEAAMQQQGKQLEKQRLVEDELLVAKKRIDDLQDRLRGTEPRAGFETRSGRRNRPFNLRQPEV